MIIYLLSAPGDFASALMYAFNQRSDTLVMDEPFYGIWLKNNGKKQAFYDEVMLRMECDDANKIHDEIENSEKIKGNIFVKNTMNTVPHMNEHRLLKYHPILLIHDPAETIVSHGIIEPALTTRDLFLEDQVRMYDWLKEKIKEDPIVINSNELKIDGAAILQKVCKILNLSYTDEMLSWPSGPKSIDGFWTQFSNNKVHASTGFQSLSSIQITREDLPKNMITIYNAVLPHYEKLLSHCI
ncbi:hypothetical protein I4U23_029616 [Adineta vaga]|nr:hypothetical protein I4U23_029616 [Adineta vaga]